MRLNLTRDFYIPKDAKVIKEEGKAIVYSSNNGKITALAFYGKANKPSWHYCFKDIAHRDNYISRWLDGIKQRNQYMIDRKQSQRREVAESDIRAGDYFSTSWGYDQTNIDFLVVVSVSPSGKTVKCKMADAIHVGESCQSDVLMPGTACGDTFQMKVNGRNSLCGSYPYCNGSMRMGYFSKTSISETHNQTMAQFGH